MTAPIVYIRPDRDTPHAGTWCDFVDVGTPYVPKADHDQWRETAEIRMQVFNDTVQVLREKDADIATLQARVAELEETLGHLYWNTLRLRGEQAYRDFARQFQKAMSHLRVELKRRQRGGTKS